MHSPSEFNEPVADFSDGLGVIRAYHQSILGFCEGLSDLVEQIELGAIQDNFGQLARQIHQNFITANDRHHQDEELALFPCLTQARAAPIAPLLEQLEEDHGELELMWAYLAPQLQDTARVRDFALFSKAMQQFVQRLRCHIEHEEEQLLPVVERLLSHEQRRQIGASMADLRQPEATY